MALRHFAERGLLEGKPGRLTERLFTDPLATR
jgi:hypothetical protein